MAFTYDGLMQSHFERIEADHAVAVAELEQARQCEDLHSAHQAASTILRLDNEREMLVRRANQYIASQQAPMIPGSENLPLRDIELCQKYGVSPNELGVAKGWTNDPKLSDEARVAQYTQNRARYQHARATGQYRDDQGSLKRG